MIGSTGGTQFPEKERAEQGFIRENHFLPQQAVIRDIVVENESVKTFSLSLSDPLHQASFSYQPGQFMMVSAPHCGEAPISFSSAHAAGVDFFRLTVRRAGKVTSALHALRPGDTITLRGPYGNSFPMAELRGSNLLFVAGGIGMAPLRGTIEYCLARRDDYGKIILLYGSRTPGEICFREEISRWQQEQLVQCHLTVDHGAPEWTGQIGLVTKLLDAVHLNPACDKALVCGPGIMIKFVLQNLETMGFAPENLITTLERHMKCGIGICGHCYLDGRLLCRDGPVLTRSQLSSLENV
jgi:NAD(P)H-flavin reductase